MNKFLLVTAISFLVISCQTKSKNSGSLNGGSGSGASDIFDSSNIFGSGDGTNGNGSVAVGSAANGGLTDADKNAVKKLVDETKDVAPKDGGYQIPKEILDQAKALLEKEKQGKDVSTEKIALAGQIINGCMNSKKLLVREPFAGQPLMGKWSGSGACTMEFEIGANPNPDVAAYPVTGGTEGQMVAALDGRGDMKTQPFAGSVTDNPKQTGKLRHPTYFPTKYGADPCDVTVKLDSSTNPIPENFKEGIKIQAQCQRQALFILSPVMDDLFKSMNGDMAKILQQRVLGM